MNPTTQKIILRASNIHKSYHMGDSVLHVLKGIDLSIPEGEILAIVGHSGAGKSTLLHILGGLDTPTSGTVDVKGDRLSAMNEVKLADFRNSRIGFVFQFHHLLPEFTALENTVMPGLIAGRKKAEVYEEAEQLLIEVGLKERLKHKPRELSGGELQRIAVARALVNDPLLVLSDEPSGNLDLKTSRSLHQLMWDIVKMKQKTFIIVTHNRELAAETDRIVEIYDGKIKMA